MTQLPTKVNTALHMLSFLVCITDGGDLSNDFDDLFADDGFKFRGFTRYSNEKINEAASRKDPKPYLKQIFKAGYPDLAAKAQTFFAQHDLL
jgi:hypothetical protein